MAEKKKFYGVASGNGRTPEIYTCWDDCRKAVHGAAGAMFRGFVTLPEALDWLAAVLGEPPEEMSSRYPWLPEDPRGPGAAVRTARPETPPEKESREPVWDAYVDGSFTPGTGAYGFGIVLAREGTIVEEKKGTGDKPDAALLRNVAGEMLGAVEAVRLARARGIRRLRIHVDYQGLIAWAEGTWKRNNVHTVAYHRFMTEASRDMDLTFVKVKAHSGDPLNERADQLAKEAVEEYVNGNR